MKKTSDYSVYSVQAGVAIGHFGDSGAGLYNKYGKLVAFLPAGHDKNGLETPVYIMLVQLARAELERMGYEFQICAPGTKAEAALSVTGKSKTKKTTRKKEGRQFLEAESKKQFEAEKKRKAVREALHKQVKLCETCREDNVSLIQSD